jgi:hypothetical protein
MATELKFLDLYPCEVSKRYPESRAKLIKILTQFVLEKGVADLVLHYLKPFDPTEYEYEVGDYVRIYNDINVCGEIISRSENDNFWDIHANNDKVVEYRTEDINGLMYMPCDIVRLKKCKVDVVILELVDPQKYTVVTIDTKEILTINAADIWRYTFPKGMTVLVPSDDYHDHPLRYKVTNVLRGYIYLEDAEGNEHVEWWSSILPYWTTPPKIGYESDTPDTYYCFPMNKKLIYTEDGEDYIFLFDAIKNVDDDFYMIDIKIIDLVDPLTGESIPPEAIGTGLLFNTKTEQSSPFTYMVYSWIKGYQNLTALCGTVRKVPYSYLYEL